MSLPVTIDAPVFSLGGTGFVFSPEGKELCFVSNQDPNEAETTNKDLWVVPAAGGALRNITVANKAFDGDPAYSPDGKTLPSGHRACPGYEADRFVIALYDRTSGAITRKGENFDNWVNEVQWAPDSKSLYFTADVQGHSPALPHGPRLGCDTADRRRQDDRRVQHRPRRFDASSFVRRAIGEPPELWICGTDGKDLRRLTTLNKAIEDEVDIRPAEELWIPSPTGKKIHTFVVKPHNFDPAEAVSAHPERSWRPADAVGRCLPRRLAGLSRFRVLRCIPESARIHRIRTGIHRCDLKGLGWKGV